MPKGWQVIILRRPKRYLQRLPENENKKILEALQNLQADPVQAPVKPLTGRPEWSLRVGDQRILLRMEKEQRRIVVTHIGPRGDVYKR